MGKLEKEYEEYLASQYKEYLGSQEAPTEEVEAAPKSKKIPAEHSYASVDPMAGSEELADAATTFPQGITTWSEEIAAAPIAAVKSSLEERTFSEIYDEEVSRMRQNIAAARERSPWATAIGEAGAGIASSFVPFAGAGKLAGAGGQIGRAAFEGLGTAEDKLGIEGAVQAGMGAGLGAGSALVGGAVKKVTTADPNTIRANVLGARTSEFKEIGIKERAKIAKELKDMGLFSNTRVDFDVDKGKFIPQSKSLESLEKPALDKLEERLNTAVTKIQDAKMSMLGAFKDNPVDMTSVESSLEAMAKKYAGKGTGMDERLAEAKSVVEKILKDIELETQELGLQAPTIEVLENAKLRLSNDVGNYGKNPLLQKTPDTSQIYQNMYTSINDSLKKQIGNNKYAKFNEMQQKLLTAKHDVTKSIASENAQRAQAGWGGWFNKMANETLGSPEAGLGMANMAEWMDNPFISPLKTPARLGVMEAPFSAMRQLDVSMPTQLPPQAEQGSPNPSKAMRNPQSVPGFDMTPMEVAKARLPRTTKGLLENKDLVIAKLSVNGVPDEMINTITQALNEDPESLEAIAPMVAMQFPTLFAKSKYNMFDGKLLDPNERAKAADETSKRDDLGSIQKAKIIKELNKSGKWIGE